MIYLWSDKRRNWGYVGDISDDEAKIRELDNQLEPSVELIPCPYPFLEWVVWLCSGIGEPDDEWFIVKPL